MQEKDKRDIDWTQLCFRRWIPTFWHSLPNMLNEAHPSFRKVALLCEADFTKSGSVCLAPHCQCAFLESQRSRSRASQPNRVVLPEALLHRQEQIDKRLKHVKGRQKRKRPAGMPSWANWPTAPVDHQWRSAACLDEEFGPWLSKKIQSQCQERAGGHRDRLCQLVGH